MHKTHKTHTPKPAVNSLLAISCDLNQAETNLPASLHNAFKHTASAPRLAIRQLSEPRSESQKLIPKAAGTQAPGFPNAKSRRAQALGSRNSNRKPVIGRQFSSQVLAPIHRGWKKASILQRKANPRPSNACHPFCPHNRRCGF